MARKMQLVCDKCERPITERDPGNTLAVMVTNQKAKQSGEIVSGDIHMKARCIRGFLNMSEEEWKGELAEFKFSENGTEDNEDDDQS